MSSQYQQQQFDGGQPGGMQSRISFPPVTPMVKRVMLLNAAVYAITLLVYLVSPQGRFLVKSVGLDMSVWRSLFPFLPVWQLGTYGFVHALEPGHLLFNMVGLYFFGTMVESTVGGARFLAHYLAAILAGGLAFVLVEFASQGNATVVGASGGVLAMIVAAACFRPNALVMFSIPLKWLAVGLVGLDLIHGALSWRASTGGMQSGGTAYLVHLAGAAYGYLAVKQRWIWFDPIQRYQVKRAVATEERRQSDAQRMDELLEKIHREGINSLDKREREFLKRVSSTRTPPGR